MQLQCVNPISDPYQLPVCPMEPPPRFPAERCYPPAIAGHRFSDLSEAVAFVDGRVNQTNCLTAAIAAGNGELPFYAPLWMWPMHNQPTAADIAPYLRWFGWKPCDNLNGTRIVVHSNPARDRITHVELYLAGQGSAFSKDPYKKSEMRPLEFGPMDRIYRKASPIFSPQKGCADDFYARAIRLGKSEFGVLNLWAALECNPDYTKAYALLGKWELEQKRVVGALHYGHKAQNRSLLAKAYRELGRDLLTAKKPRLLAAAVDFVEDRSSLRAAALWCLEKSAGLQGSGLTYALLAQAQETSKNAWEYFFKACRLETTHCDNLLAVAHKYGEQLVVEKDLENARLVYERTATLVPRDKRIRKKAWDINALQSRERGNYERAVKFAERSWELVGDENSRGNYLALLRQAAQREQPLKALEHLRKILELKPGDGDARAAAIKLHKGEAEKLESKSEEARTRKWQERLRLRAQEHRKQANVLEHTRTPTLHFRDIQDVVAFVSVHKHSMNCVAASIMAGDLSYGSFAPLWLWPIGGNTEEMYRLLNFFGWEPSDSPTGMSLMICSQNDRPAHAQLYFPTTNQVFCHDPGRSTRLLFLEGELESCWPFDYPFVQQFQRCNQQEVDEQVRHLLLDDLLQSVSQRPYSARRGINLLVEERGWSGRDVAARCLKRGQEAQQEGLLTVAETLFWIGLEQDQASVDLWIALGRLALETGLYGDALHYSYQAHALQPELASPTLSEAYRTFATLLRRPDAPNWPYMQAQASRFFPEIGDMSKAALEAEKRAELFAKKRPTT